jgi:hypothetical protein
MGEWRYSSTILDIGTRDGGEWSDSRTDGFSLGKIAPDTHWIGTGWVWTLWRREETCHAGNRSRAVQSVDRRYTDLSYPDSLVR